MKCKLEALIISMMFINWACDFAPLWMKIVIQVILVIGLLGDDY